MTKAKLRAWATTMGDNAVSSMRRLDFYCFAWCNRDWTHDDETEWDDESHCYRQAQLDLTASREEFLHSISAATSKDREWEASDMTEEFEYQWTEGAPALCSNGGDKCQSHTARALERAASAIVWTDGKPRVTRGGLLRVWKALNLDNRPLIGMLLDEPLPTFICPTDARYETLNYPTQGILVAYNNISPASAIQWPFHRGWTGGPLPPLAAWSDIQYLEWHHLCTSHNVDPKGLKTVMRSNVINKATQAVMWLALESVGITDGPKAWPGTKFDMSTDAGRAILGTPNGNGVGWLLFSHREGLGWKTITSVTMWDQRLSPKDREDQATWRMAARPCLVFDVVDYDPETAPPGEGGGDGDTDMSDAPAATN
ncbi:hypothetical protein LTR08_008856 [Meristemomyces frigidus]|nr:hypothetical protein LTR08_008856 [Meristemomyces frigidus]